MRLLPIFLCLLMWTASLEAQKVPSSCETQDSVLYWYQRDAARLCVLEFSRQGSNYADSVQFPQSIFNKKLDALIAVYNATSLPASDTATHQLRIHEYTAFANDEFYFKEDSSLFWMKALKNGQIPTGFTELDSLLALYDFSLLNYSDYPILGKHSVTLRCNQVINLYPLEAAFSKIDIKGHVNGVIGDGNSIKDSVYSDHIELIFSKGWGDCPSGCTARRYWKFKVYDDCSVEFVESYGSNLPPAVGIENPLADSWNVYPLPFNNVLHIGGLSEPNTYHIYGLNGQIIKSGQTENASIHGLGDLPKGLYILRLQNQGQIQTVKIIKQ